MKKTLIASLFLLPALAGFCQNVGIGTNTPIAKLDIRGDSTDDGITLDLGNSDQSHRLRFFGGRQTDPNPYIGVKSGDPIRFAIDAPAFIELMRINPNGNVGIATTNPSNKLSVNGDANFTGNVGMGTTSPQKRLDINAGTVQISFEDDIAGGAANGTIRAIGTGIYGASLYLINTLGGTVGVGILASSSGGALIMDAGTGTFAPVAASAFNVNSDITLKKDIVQLGSSSYETYLQQLRQIQSITYRYNNEASTASATSSPYQLRATPHIGFSAQSLPAATQAYIPQSNSKHAPVKLGYNLSDMAGLTVVCVKALDEKTTTLQQEIVELKKLNETLVKRVEILEGAGSK